MAELTPFPRGSTVFWKPRGARSYHEARVESGKAYDYLVDVVVSICGNWVSALQTEMAEDRVTEWGPATCQACLKKRDEAPG